MNTPATNRQAMGAEAQPVGPAHPIPPGKGAGSEGTLALCCRLAVCRERHLHREGVNG